MFSDEIERRDWIFGVFVTLVIVGGLFLIRSQPLEEKRERGSNESAALSTPAIVKDDRPDARSSYRDTYVRNEFSGRRSPDAIARVFECERNGQRILSDQPCGTDASVREIAAPNRMRAQDTSSLYDPPPRSIQVQKLRASQHQAGSNVSLCASIDREKDWINARMRQPYTSWEGESYRERLRQLSARRWDAGCGK